MTLEAGSSLHIDGCPAELSVLRLIGTERVHAPFSFEITVAVAPSRARRAALDVEALLCRRAELQLHHEDAPRVVYGLIDRIDGIAAGYRVVLVPRLASLDDSVDHRVFLDRDTVEIATAVLEGHTLDVERRVTRALTKRPQCVQAFESDLAFVRRLLAEEGVLFHLEHARGRDVLVLSDHPSGYHPIAGDEVLPYEPGEAAGLLGGEAVFSVELTRSAAPTRVTLRDRDFERPSIDKTAEAGAGAIERYEHPAGYADVAVGKALAAIRLEEAGAEKLILRGRTTSRRLSPGFTFELKGAPREGMNGRWLVIELHHRGTDFGAGVQASGRRYEATFVAVPAQAPYRPARLRPASLGGVQTATVTGPKGAEIHTEAHGRIKALLRWDRLHEDNDKSSHWLRTVQPPISGGIFVSRAGWEVLLGFAGVSGDTPYALGRLSHGEAMPPEDLPAQKAVSAFGTRTTPGGGSSNLLRMDDAAGREGMTLEASRDYKEKTENDKETSVTGDDVRVIGGDRTEMTGIAREMTVTAAQTYSVGADREVATGGSLFISAASESVSVGGLRFFQVGGDDETSAATLTRSVGAAKAEVALVEVNRHVTGASTVLVGGGWTEIGGLMSSTSVLGLNALTVGGPMSIKTAAYSLKASALKETYASRTITAGGKRMESFGGAARLSVGGSLTMKGTAVFFKAADKITIQASGAKITITPDEIKVKGPFDVSGASIVTGDEAND